MLAQLCPIERQIGRDQHGAKSVVGHQGVLILSEDAIFKGEVRNCRQIEIVRLLVRHGADPHATDRRGVTPLDAGRTAEMKQALTDTGTPGMQSLPIH